MRTREGTLTRKGLIVTGAGFVALTALVLVLMGTAVTHRALHETYGLAQETVTFLEGTCEKFDNAQLGYSAKSLQTLKDAAEGFAKFLPSEKVNVDNDLLREFIQSEHLSGLIVLDASGAPAAQADLDEANPSALWQDVIANPAVQNIFQHPEVTYSDIVDRDGTSYEIVAIPYDGGVLVAYESLEKPTADPYEQTIGDLLASNTFHKDPVVVMVKNDEAVSSNESDLVGKPFEEMLNGGGAVSWRDDALTLVSLNGDAYYALRTSYEDYQFYVLYSDSEVFADRFGLLAAGLSLYLALAVAILVVRGYFDKRNLRATQKQLSIINAISATYETTFLLHLDTMQMESIKMSPAVAKVFEKHTEPVDFLEHVCRDVVVPEYRETVFSLMDGATMEQRLQGNAFLGIDIKACNGVWYSLQVIPQRRDAQGHLLSVLVATRDVTAVKRAEELSFRDKLTGLRNRNYLESRDGELMRPGDFPISVIMADCNYLKRTNDTLGHEWGDKLLVRVAGVLQRCVPEHCLIMRIGGDEFLLVCPQTGDVEVDGVIANIRAGLAAASDDDLTLSVSFGACTVLDGETTFDEAFKAADEAMYAEKQATHAADGQDR